ncbi:Polynucleotidyl transferase- ribonuclease H-like superfamily protein, partial [Striga hermonthica]
RRARGHPFSADILAAPLPNNYKDTNLVFDGTSDPSRHVRTFENMVVLHGYTDPVSCRAFLSTLRGGALDWFQQLPPGSIVDFEDFAEKLTNQYSSAVAQEKTYLTLMAMRQGEKESLRKYVARYNQACLEIPSTVDEVKMGGLIRSLRAGPCRTSLAKTPAHTYDEVLRRCRKYINLEETEAEFAKLEELGRGESRKEKAVSPKRKASPKREGRAKQDRGLYFLGHRVKVRTNMPLGETLGRPSVSGRLVKWAVELSEYTIIYEPRRAIKAQALADFIQEGTKESEESEGVWQVFADGSVSRAGGGLGIVLMSPKGDILEFAIKVAYQISNNEAEYEAVIKGLKLALSGGARAVQVHSDSQLVVDQFQEGFEVREERMMKYVEEIMKLQGEFDSFELIQIPRGENGRADLLAKMAQ